MDSYYRHRRFSPLSASLPDVTAGEGDLNEANFLFSPAKSAGADYNIDDDAWADKTDPNTGSVFHVQATQNSNIYENSASSVRSNSSSSLSSNPSMTDLPPPSPTMPFQSLPEGFVQSLQSPSPSNKEDPIRKYSSSTVYPPQKPRSIRKKIKKAVLRSGKGKPLSKSGQTASLSDLSSFSEIPSPSTVPEATLYGSRGIPLKSKSFHGSRQSVVKVHLNVHTFRTDYMHCSLETLGIIPVRSLTRRKFGSLTSLKIKPKNPSSLVSAHPVVIRGVVPGTTAAQSQQLHSGDTILRVNGHSVCLENIDVVLANVENELSFVVKKGHFNDSTSPTHSLPGGLVRLVAGGKSAIKTHLDTVSHHSHLLVYLTLDTEEDDAAEKDIVYKFPPSEDKKRNALIQLKGVFLTLSDVMHTIVSGVQSCSTVVLDGEVVHLSFIQYNKEVLLLALPGTVVSQYQVQLIIGQIAETLQLLYGNVKRAFMNADNYSTLDHIFSLLFDKLFAEQQSDSSLLGVSAISKLKLPTDIAVKLSVALSGLESADHNDRLETLHMRRPYTILGSCLMYRGALACGHMPESFLQNVVTFCNSYRLLEIAASDSICQIVIWKEIHLKGLDTIFLSHQKRTFLLVVGLEHVLLCIIMEQTIHNDDSCPCNVDAVYVDRGRTLILELKAHDVLAECETRGILSAPLPSLVSTDSALKLLHTSETTTPKRKRLSDAGLTRSLSLLEDGSDSDSPNHSGITDTPKRSPAIGRRRSHSLLNIQLRTPKSRMKDASDVVINAKARASRAMYSLTAGPSNILLQYVSLYPGMGMIVCPIHATGLQPIQIEVIQCFRQACVSIRQVLQGQANNYNGDDTNSDETTDERTTVDVVTAPFTIGRNSYFEYGVLFQYCSTYSSEKHISTLTYWVVGRLFQDKKAELYVCYQENTSQDMVEMAFRLLFGWIA